MLAHAPKQQKRTTRKTNLELSRRARAHKLFKNSTADLIRADAGLVSLDFFKDIANEQLELLRILHDL